MMRLNLSVRLISIPLKLVYAISLVVLLGPGSGTASAQSSENITEQDSLYATCITSLYEKMDHQFNQEPVVNVPPGGIVSVKKYIEKPTLDKYEVSYKKYEGYTTETCFEVVSEEEIGDISRYNNYVDSLRKEGLSVILDVAEGSEPNSSGGVDYEIEIYNNSREKTIKYINIEATPYNAVGDKVWGSIKEKSKSTMEGVGPVEPFGHAYFNFENVWYNSTISCVEMNKMTVEYVDGSRFIYVNDLSKIRSYKWEDEKSDEKSIYINGECR